MNFSAYIGQNMPHNAAKNGRKDALFEGESLRPVGVLYNKLVLFAGFGSDKSRGVAEVGFDISAEVGNIGETELHGDFLNRHVAVYQEHLNALNKHLADDGFSRFARADFAHMSEVFRRYVEHLGVVPNGAMRIGLFSHSFAYRGDEALEDNIALSHGTVVGING